VEPNKEQGEVRIAHKEIYFDTVNPSDIVSMVDILEHFSLGGTWIGAVSGRIKRQTRAAVRLRHNVGLQIL
jgi:hypothetical protein